MPIDQAFLDGLTDVPQVGQDGVGAPTEGEKTEQRPAVEANGTNGGGPKAEPSEVGEKVIDTEGTEEDAIALLESLFDDVKPAAKPATEEVKTVAKTAQGEVKTELPTELKLDLSFFPKTDEEFDQIIASRSSFLAFQGKLLEASQAFYEAKIKGILDQLPGVQTRAVEEAIKKAAEFVPQNVQTQLTLQRMVDKFYESNPSLLPIRTVVGKVANKISAAHPDWSYEQVFSETAKQANKVLGMLNLPQGGAQQNGGKQKPAFAKGSGGRKPAVERTGIQKDIDFLIS